MPTDTLNPKAIYTTYLTRLKDEQRYRSLRRPVVVNPADDYSHNDYLGLSSHPALVKAAKEAANQYGVGSRASQLLSGYSDLMDELSAMIAKDKGYESCVLFSSGYQANATLIQALLNPQVLPKPPLVLSDRSLHASLHAGFQAVGAKQIRYHHLDLDHLAELLAVHVDYSGPRFIVSESVFGMEGDAVDVAKITELAKRYGAFLYIDEAHATGVVGQKGYGLTQGYGGQVDLVMGTFSKALGVSGAYACMSSDLKDYLVNTCAGLIYTTAPSPMLLAAAKAAWLILPSLSAERAALQALRAYLRDQLMTMGCCVGGDSESAILPLYLGKSCSALSLRDHLARSGIMVSAIRPPSVPPRKAMIRIALNVHHRKAGVDRLIKEIAQWQNR
jgi:8-amino-7-oxononanoate synthase